MTLDELRRHLDELDLRLLQTIAERQAMSREVARVKRATGYPTRDYARERDVIVGARAAADRIGVSPDVAETVIRLLIRSSLTTQEQASVVAHGSGSGRRALVIGGAGKMGAWFAQFLTSQGFDVEVADPKAVLKYVPVDQDIATNMAAIPRDEVPDLPDRIIAATAHLYGIPVLTRDGRIWSSKRTASSAAGHGSPASASITPSAAVAERRAPGVALQTHHHFGTGMLGGGLAPSPEFSTAIRDPHSI